MSVRSLDGLWVGTVVHCSLASHMTDCVIQHPEASRPEVSTQDWAEATDGRIQCLKITRPGPPYTWKFVGVYQHVAKSKDRNARSLLRSTLNELVSAALVENHRVVVLGDFNAAPPGGRWGYPNGALQ